MADKKTYSGLSRKSVDIPAYSVVTVDYLDTKPNYFRVQNNGSATIYCGVSAMPTATSNDFVVRANSMKMYTDPFQRSRLYIYNPSGSAINAIVVTFAAEFDPLALAFGEIEVTIPTVIQAASSIDAFGCSLPAGTNKIGKVELDGDSQFYLQQASTYLYNMVTDSAFSNIVNLASLEYRLNQINRALHMDNIHTESLDSTSAAIDYNVSTGGAIQKIVFCANDGTTNKVLTWYDRGDGTAHNLTIKPGESVDDMPINARSIEYAAGGGRLVFVVKGD